MALRPGFPKTLDAIFGATETVARRVAAYRRQVPDLPVRGRRDRPDPRRAGRGQTALSSAPRRLYWYIGKDLALAFDTAASSASNSRQQTAWMMEGGGLQLMRSSSTDHNIHNIPCGKYLGTQMGGWFRKEIKSLDDFRASSSASAAWPAGAGAARRGAPADPACRTSTRPSRRAPSTPPNGSGPLSDDQKLGFKRVAILLLPGLVGRRPQLSLYVNALSLLSRPRNTTILKTPCADAHAEMNLFPRRRAPTFRRLIGAGTQLRPSPTT